MNCDPRQEKDLTFPSPFLHNSEPMQVTLHRVLYTSSSRQKIYALLKRGGIRKVRRGRTGLSIRATAAIRIWISRCRVEAILYSASPGDMRESMTLCVLVP